MGRLLVLHLVFSMQMRYTLAMDQSSAQQHAKQLNQEHPERDQYRWFARAVDKSHWEVVRVAVPGRAAATGTAQVAKTVGPSNTPHGELPGGLPNWSA